MTRKKITQDMISKTVIQQNNDVVTSSLSVAYVFGKPHRSVLRDADKVNKRSAQNCATPNNKIKFYNTTYIHPQNHQRYRKVLMNKHAFLHVVMGFTGNKAFRFKEAYFNCFDELEKKVAQQPKVNKLKDRRQSLIMQISTDNLRKYEQEHHNRVLLEDKRKQELPKVHYFDKYLDDSDLYTMSSIANDYGVSAHQMNMLLHKFHIVYKQGKTWMVYSPYSRMKLAGHHLHYKGEKGYNINQLKWTNRGKRFINELFDDKGIRSDNIHDYIELNKKRAVYPKTLQLKLKGSK